MVMGFHECLCPNDTKGDLKAALPFKDRAKLTSETEIIWTTLGRSEVARLFPEHLVNPNKQQAGRLH
jgi:hypothetical protein